MQLAFQTTKKPERSQIDISQVINLMCLFCIFMGKTGTQNKG